MAMTVRLPAELDAQLEAVARAKHTSKHAILIEAATRYVNCDTRAAQVNAAVDFVMHNDRALLERLEDA